MPEPATASLPSRAALERAIEALIGLLDEIDAPFEEREPNDGGEDEAYLHPCCIDDDCEPDADSEPYLCWADDEASFGVYGWAAGDREEDETIEDPAGSQLERAA